MGCLAQQVSCHLITLWLVPESLGPSPSCTLSSGFLRMGILGGHDEGRSSWVPTTCMGKPGLSSQHQDLVWLSSSGCRSVGGCIKGAPCLFINK